ncbi:unnamed protein product [Cuscuta campestris]|uniref:MATH domain-containing protein n=1 Tax=Cuscuta campestris TaxID=132261 RepID=A0A484MMV5_9ASTE|nr:unnamed protein product [Cuscuta campestris]
MWSSSSSRDIPPSHFIFMIRSFSQLTKSGIDRLESGVFEASQKKWKLCVYTKARYNIKAKNGDEDDDDEHYISLCLRIVDTDSLPRGWEVHARFTFFVYDQINDKYLTIQDGGEKVRRFHYMKTQWGLDQFLPLSIFNNPSNGYLVDDTCAFGAEVFVVSNAPKRECLSITPTSKENTTYTWRINHFASITSESVTSDEFFLEGIKWTIKLYPKGSSTGKGHSISLYLMLSAAQYENLNAAKLYAKYKLRICNQLSATQHHETHVEHLFDDPKLSGYGVHKFMSLNKLESGYLVNDTLIVQVDILLLSKVSEF